MKRAGRPATDSRAGLDFRLTLTAPNAAVPYGVRLMTVPKVGFLFVVLSVLSLVPGRAFAAGVEVEAFAGEPFGVARISFPMSDAPGVVDLERIRVTDADGRAAYPGAVPGPLGRVFGFLLKDAGPLPIGRINVSFLFHGNDPFDV